MSPCQSCPLEEDAWPSQVAAKVVAEPGEDLAVERSGTGKCDDHRRPIRPPPGPPGALQVIRLPWRYIPHQHSTEAADVDTQFERSGRAEHVTDSGPKEVLKSSVGGRRELGAMLLGP